MRRSTGSGERHEPRFGEDRAQKGDFRASAADRPTAAALPADRDIPPDLFPSPKDSSDPMPARAAKRKPAGGRKRRSLPVRLLYWSGVLAIWGVVVVGGIVGWYAAHLPAIHSLEIPKRPPNVRIVDSNGALLANRGETGGALVHLKDLPPYVPQAFIAIEDRRFYDHFGVDVIGLARAFATNLRAGGMVQGGSTISQQLAKNLFLTPERNLGRKVQEVILALWLEQHYSKDQLLELYLNRVYFGAGAYGIEAASQRYFGKSARSIRLTEAATLAGLVKAPSRLAPTRNPAAARERAELVLAAMADAGMISSTDAQRAFAVAAPAATPKSEGSTGYAADWITEQLDDLIGAYDQDIVVDTTIDLALQAEAERDLRDTLAKRGAELGVEQGALVAIDPGGAVKALVGGRSYAESQFNRAVAAHRQPGSAFKPFVYLTALERGITPDAIRSDAPISIKGWSPDNFDHKYRGNVRLSQALATSLNTVAVRLAIEVGPAAVVKTAQRLGITSPLEPNASLALGTSEVTPLELVAAYVPLANGGNGISAYAIRRVRTADGKLLYERRGPDLGQVVDPAHVGMMNAMLEETLRVGTARRAELPGWPAAGKTGTSQDFRDAWFVGYTAKLVTGVWLGNDDARPTKRASGSNLPVEIWSRFMQKALAGEQVASLPGTELWAARNAPAEQPDPVYAERPARVEPTPGFWGTGPAVALPTKPARARQPNFLEKLFGG